MHVNKAYFSRDGDSMDSDNTLVTDTTQDCALDSNGCDSKRDDKPRSRCTEKDLFCYPVTLNYVIDGKCEVMFDPDPEFYFQHFAKVGKGERDIIAAGRKAAEIFYNATGIDFTGLPGKAYIYGVASTKDGSVRFSPAHLPDECLYRLTTIQVRDQAQVINKPISDIYWSINFLKPTRVYGTINDMLPTGANLISGSYVILPCERHEKNCKSIHNPQNPYAPIFFEYFTRGWAGVNNPGPYGQLDITDVSSQFGKGRGQGVIYSEANRQKQGVQVIRFGGMDH